MDGFLRLVAGFHPPFLPRVGSDTSEQAAPPLRDGDCPRQQIWRGCEVPNKGNELGKRKQPWSSQHRLGWCRKPPRAWGSAAQHRCCGLVRWQGRTLAIEPCCRNFAPAKPSALPVAAIWRCLLQVWVWVRVGGCFPAVIAEALPTHAGGTTSLPVIACPGICGYVLRAV